MTESIKMKHRAFQPAIILAMPNTMGKGQNTVA
jgi:hypothetical protein